MTKVLESFNENSNQKNWTENLSSTEILHIKINVCCTEIAQNVF